MSDKPRDRCPCGGIILADTEDWKVPLCYECYRFGGLEQELVRERARNAKLREATEKILIKALTNIAGPKRKDGTYFYSIPQIQRMGDDGADTDTARYALEKWAKALEESEKEA